ncbi:MAG: hypothetical protein P4L92_00930 [Rudaea sp.]|nr:hypothetical protein [Rudaea sp.]
MKLALLLCLTFFASWGHAQDRRQLEEFESKFLNQKIVINGNFLSTPSPRVDWMDVGTPEQKFL